MSRLKFARTSGLGEGERGQPEPTKLIEGTPEFRSWSLLEGKIASGVWSASPGHHRVIRDESMTESFYIVEGEIELYEDGFETPQRFGRGDLVVIEPGFTGSWKTISSVKKIYFTTQR